MLHLNYSKAETTENDEGAEDLGQIGERAEIGHLVPHPPLWRPREDSNLRPTV